MKTLSKDPFSDMNEMFQRFLEHLQHTHRLPTELLGTPQGPNVNICETDTHFYVFAELPGYKPEDTRITIKDDTLIIQGERKPMTEVYGSRCLHLEITFGPFRRVLRLPSPVDADKAQAEFHHGMLKIILQKKHKDNEIRQISIEVKE